VHDLGISYPVSHHCASAGRTAGHLISGAASFLLPHGL
jgi:hypothetical protein